MATERPDSQATFDSLNESVRRILRFIGEDPDRDGLRDTPKRFISAVWEMTRGMELDAAKILDKKFEAQCDQMVVLRDVPFYSLCEHHLLPFYGTITLGYIPNCGVVVGLSKLARLVNLHSRKLQIQERLTSDLANDIFDHLSAQGAGVVVKAHHTCMGMRGIKSRGDMVTSALLGSFQKGKPRREFLALSGM